LFWLTALPGADGVQQHTVDVVRTQAAALRRIIRDAGFIPKQRDTLYRTYFLN
jgi:2-iminoacetate synthase ThiH